MRAHFPRGRLAFYFIRRALDEMARARLLSVLCALLHGCRATHYATLGISRSASSAEIKRAYRKKALEHHPDKVAPSQREEAAERFKEIQEAYTTLSDPAARRRYDVGGETPFGRAGSSPFGHAPPPGFQHFQDFHFHQRPVVPPSRATRPFYVSLMELDRGCQRDFELKDTPITRLCDAWSDGFMGDAASAALYRTCSFAFSLLWRFPTLLFGVRGKRWLLLRLPVAALAFLASLSNQLPRSPTGKYSFEVKPGWRQGTRIVFGNDGDGAKDGEARPVAFELRERRHPRLARRQPYSSGDLLWRGSISYARALEGTRVVVGDHLGNTHELNVKLTPAEASEGAALERKVATGAGLPRKRGKVGEDRGDLWALLTPRGGPASESECSWDTSVHSTPRPRTAGGTRT